MSSASGHNRNLTTTGLVAGLAVLLGIGAVTAAVGGMVKPTSTTPRTTQSASVPVSTSASPGSAGSASSAARRQTVANNLATAEISIEEFERQVDQLFDPNAQANPPSSPTTNADPSSLSRGPSAATRARRAVPPALSKPAGTNGMSSMFTLVPDGAPVAASTPVDEPASAAQPVRGSDVEGLLTDLEGAKDRKEIVVPMGPGLVRTIHRDDEAAPKALPASLEESATVAAEVPNTPKPTATGLVQFLGNLVGNSSVAPAANSTNAVTPTSAEIQKTEAAPPQQSAFKVPVAPESPRLNSANSGFRPMQIMLLGGDKNKTLTPAGAGNAGAAPTQVSPTQTTPQSMPTDGNRTPPVHPNAPGLFPLDDNSAMPIDTPSEVASTANGQPIIQATGYESVQSTTMHEASAVPVTIPIATAQSGGVAQSGAEVQNGIQQVGCNCGSGMGGPTTGNSMWNQITLDEGGMRDPAWGCDNGTCTGVDCQGCCSSCCYLGRERCYPCEGKNVAERFVCLMYDVICCPDPCYELSGPHWFPAANNAFFADSSQPVSQTRLRWDAGHNVTEPDRSNYFWNPLAQQTAVSASVNQTLINNGDNPIPNQSVNYDRLSMYIETATKNGKFSAFVDTPFLSVDPDLSSRHAAFSDLLIGTKSVLFDRELIQITFKLTNTVPVGNLVNGTGLGIYAIEPSGLYTLKLGKEFYLQGEVAQWIGFGSTNAGGVLHFHNSFNKTIWRMNPSVALVGSAEMSAYTFTGGRYTDPTNLYNTLSSSGGRYYYFGPGARIVYCDQMDFGLAGSFAVSKGHFAEQILRVEMRLRY